MTFPLRAVRIFSSLALLLIATSASAIVSVGPKTTNPDNPSDPYYGCRFRSIQDAINYIHDYELTNDPDTVDHYVVLAGAGNLSSGVYNEKIVVDGTDVPGAQGFRVDFFGGYDDLCDHAVGTRTVIGAGGSQLGNSVLEVKGNATVYLHDLVMTDADVIGHGAGEGGGINFHGSGLLDITGVDLNGNFATSGGGIFAHGEGGGLTLNLHSGTVIENNTATSAGGGIDFTGHGSLQIDNTQILSNTANFGGGIYIDPDAATTANVLDGVSLYFNTANESGGGIFVKGNTKLYANNAAQTLIGLNNAPGGYGGGVFVIGPATAYLSANIFSNTASYGGGIAVAGARDLENGYGTVALSAPASNIPVNVSGNTAYFTGGGIYLKPIYDNTYNYASLCASDFRIDLNQAQEGTAIYADTDASLGLHIGGKVELNTGCAPRSICSAGSGCNEINGNIAATSTFQPTDGSTILMQTDGVLNADRVALQQNQGGHVLRGLEVDSENAVGYNIDVGDCLITDNQLTHEIVYSDHTLAMDNCTVTHNTTGATHVIRVSGDSPTLTNSIIDQDADTFDFAGNNNSASRSIFFVLTNHPDPTLPLNPTVLVGSPHFVNPDQLNYRLQPDSIGLDTAPEDSRALDLDGYSRDVDLPLVPDFPVPGQTTKRDLGAYELQLFQLPPPPPPPTCVQADTIFCNGFE